MSSSHMRTQSREILMVAAPIILLSALAFWAAYQFVAPPPPTEITITSGSENGAYHKFAQLYADKLASADIKVNILTSKGSAQNVERLGNGDTNAEATAQVALVQGGTASAKTSKGIVSLGRVFTEPLWVFYRSDTVLDTLAQLKGKRLAIGATGSGTRLLADELLKKNGIDADNTKVLPISGTRGVNALMAGDADAVFLVMAPNAQPVAKLLRTNNVRLMSFKHGEAYTRLFPYLTTVTLPAGVVDLVNNVPPQDVTLIAPEAALVARDDTHPAIVGLLVQAAIDVHAQGGMFQNIGEYPKPRDPDFPMSEDAQRMYKSGAPFFRRYLPFWLATFIERMLVMIVPIATIMIPLVKIVPMAYEWRIKSRINYWYAQLKHIEKGLRQDPDHLQTAEFKAQITEIDDAVSAIPVPLHFSDRFYELRAAVDLVHQRVDART